MAQDVWQAHYQISSIIFLKELIKLNVNTNTMTRNVKFAELNISICDCFLKYRKFKDDLIKYKSLCSNKNYQQNFD